MHGKSIENLRLLAPKKAERKLSVSAKLLSFPSHPKTCFAKGKNVIYVIGIPPSLTSPRHQFAPCCRCLRGYFVDGWNIIIEIVLVLFCVAEHVRKTFYYVLLFGVAIRESERHDGAMEGTADPTPRATNNFGIKFHFIFSTKHVWK